MKKLIIFIIKCYQKFLSPLFPSKCRFYPCCSAYSRECIDKFGVIKGCYLSFFRIIRCNPLFKGGVDYVPNKFSFVIKKNNIK